MSKCAFPGCPNDKSPKAAQGLCNSHYWQMHKGRELTPLSYRRNVTEPWLTAHVGHEGDDCLIWPFQRNESGYAMVRWRGKQTIATRVMCGLVRGTAPSDKHEAAHSCGNGHLGCIHPGHLSWKTPVENAADKEIHGTVSRGERQGSAKMTEGTVRAIREFAHTCSQATIGHLFGISQGQAGRIIRGEQWSHVT